MFEEIQTMVTLSKLSVPPSLRAGYEARMRAGVNVGVVMGRGMSWLFFTSCRAVSRPGPADSYLFLISFLFFCPWTPKENAMMAQSGLFAEWKP